MVWPFMFFMLFMVNFRNSSRHPTPEGSATQARELGTVRGGCAFKARMARVSGVSCHLTRATFWCGCGQARREPGEAVESRPRLRVGTQGGTECRPTWVPALLTGSHMSLSPDYVCDRDPDGDANPVSDPDSDKSVFCLLTPDS
jgi:hypothetical protein